MTRFSFAEVPCLAARNGGFAPVAAPAGKFVPPRHPIAAGLRLSIRRSGHRLAIMAPPWGQGGLEMSTWKFGNRAVRALALLLAGSSAAAADGGPPATPAAAVSPQ